MTQHGQLDPVDYKILGILQQNARLDIVRIAGQVHKSHSSTTDRIRRLVEKGYIQRFIALLDRRLIGRPILMIVQVKLSIHTTESLRTFSRQMQQLSEVQVCLHLSGEYDFLLQVSLRDPLEYQGFLDQKLCSLPAIEKVHSSLVLNECKMELALPL